MVMFMVEKKQHKKVTKSHKKASETKEKRSHKSNVKERAKEQKVAKLEEKNSTHKVRKRRTSKRKKVKSVVARGKRKRAIARATIKEGNGIIRINKQNVDAIPNKYIRYYFEELRNLLGHKADKVDISINVKGGGIMGQIEAARTAAARGLVEYFEDENLRKAFLEYDRNLLVEDPRRVEPKKYKGPKARARFQKSYR